MIAPTARQSCVCCNASLADRITVGATVNGFWTAVHCRFRCTVCGHESPLNHLDFDGSVECLRCGVDQRFALEQWLKGVAHAHAVGDLCGPSPQGRFPSGIAIRHNRFESIGVGHTFAESQQSGVEIGPEGVVQHSLTVTAMPGHPPCPKCKTPLAVHAATTEFLDVGCPSCPHRARYFLAAGVAQAMPGLGGVLAEEHAQGGRDAELQEDASGAVAMRCPNCTAPLPVDGQQTVVQCSYCSIAVRLPSSTLRRLGHQSPRAELWWLYFTAPSAERAELERDALAEQQRGVPARPGPGAPYTPKRRGKHVELFVASSLGLVMVGGTAVFLINEQRLKSVYEDAKTPVAQASAAPAPPPRPAPKLQLEWGGKVIAAQGKPLKRREPCVVKLEANGSAIQWVMVSCGSERLYDSRTPLNGTSMSSSGIGEAPHAKYPGKYGYAVSYQDTGQRSGRSQLKLDTTQGKAVVFSEGIPEFRVDIAVDVTSQPRAGEPIYDTPKHAAKLSLELVVESASGPVGVQKGAACRLDLAFANSLPNAAMCTTSLSCNKRWLYGKKDQPGFTACVLDSAGSPIKGSDKQPVSGDGSPELEVDVKARRVTLESSEDGYKVVFAGRS